MKTAAIICEYNPLHNGHLYHMQETKKSGITHLIAVLSDDFVQRGDAALLNKFDRAQLALRAGADLVVELPVPFSCAGAERYARGAVQLLKNLNIIDYLSFGCSGNIKLLEQLASGQEDSPRIRELLKAGYSYPSAVYQASTEQFPPEQTALLLDANNLLALEYLRAMQKEHVRFRPMAILRNSVLHDSPETSGSFASASLIRNRFFSQEAYQEYIPDFTADLLSERALQGKTADFRRLESAVLYKMRMISEQELLSLPDMTSELAGKFLKAKTAASLEEFLHTVKSKCVTMARLRRILLYAMLAVRKEDFSMQIPYLRVLGFRQTGTELLKQIKITSSVPVGTSLARLRKISPEAERLVQLEINAANLYGLAQKQVSSAEEEFRIKINLKK